MLLRSNGLRISRQLNTLDKMIELDKKISGRDAKIGIVGLGRTGLPLALAFVESGFTVYGVDTDHKKLNSLRRNRSYILDIPSKSVKRAMISGRLKFAKHGTLPKNLDCIVICVPTPLNKTKDPDISYILEVIGQIKRNLKKGMLIVLQSTTYPGTTHDMVLPNLEESGLKCGKDFFLAYSPERFNPGCKDFTTRNIPRVVGGISTSCTEISKKLFSTIVEEVHTASSTQTVEMMKLLENTFRSVNIALINEMAIMCEKLDINIWEVIEKAGTKPFGFMPFYPGPGTGGHCIPVDPQYLSWKLRLLDYKARFVELAGEINSEMPEFIVKKITELLNKKSKAVKDARILLMGMAYKRNSDDFRESPSLDIFGILDSMKAKVSYSDPYIPEFESGGKKIKSVNLSPSVLSKQDIVVILTDHQQFDFEPVSKHAQLIFDTRNVFNGTHNKKIYTL